MEITIVKIADSLKELIGQTQDSKEALILRAGVFDATTTLLADLKMFTRRRLTSKAGNPEMLNVLFEKYVTATKELVRRYATKQ
ncbi:MAG: hypothetical protein ISS66_21565 [Desulfobacteraceae bacterium]|nr:hypothetical protein [Desulfobacteraceae bacterium]